MKFQSGDIIVDVDKEYYILYGHGFIINISVSNLEYNIIWSKRPSPSYQEIGFIDDRHDLSTDIFREDFQ